MRLRVNPTPVFMVTVPDARISAQVHVGDWFRQCKYCVPVRASRRALTLPVDSGFAAAA